MAGLLLMSPTAVGPCGTRDSGWGAHVREVRGCQALQTAHSVSAGLAGTDPEPFHADAGGNQSEQAGVLAQLQGYLEAYMALDTSATADKEARGQVESQLVEAQKYYATLKAAVATYFGAGSPQLVKFGLKPRKARAPLTTAQLAGRAAKAKATREPARNEGFRAEGGDQVRRDDVRPAGLPDGAGRRRFGAGRIRRQRSQPRNGQVG